MRSEHLPQQPSQPEKTVKEHPATRTQVREIDFYQALKSRCPDFGLASLSLIMAQWALETGRGLKCMNFNVGNFKARKDADFTYFQTYERLAPAIGQKYLAESTVKEPCELIRQMPSGAMLISFKPRHPVAKFAAYASLEEGLTDYLLQLSTRFPEAYQAAKDGIPHAFITALLKGHYFTGSALLYADGVYKLAREYQSRFGQGQNLKSSSSTEEFPSS